MESPGRALQSNTSTLQACSATPSLPSWQPSRSKSMRVLSERVVAGLRRAKREGKILGRRRIILDREKVRAMHMAGQSVRAIAATMGVSKSLIGNILGEQNAGSTLA